MNIFGQGSLDQNTKYFFVFSTSVLRISCFRVKNFQNVHSKGIISPLGIGRCWSMLGPKNLEFYAVFRSEGIFRKITPNNGGSIKLFLGTWDFFWKNSFSRLYFSARFVTYNFRSIINSKFWIFWYQYRATSRKKKCSL